MTCHLTLQEAQVCLHKHTIHARQIQARVKKLFSIVPKHNKQDSKDFKRETPASLEFTVQYTGVDTKRTRSLYSETHFSTQ